MLGDLSPQTSYSIVQVVATQFNAGEEISIEFDSMFFFESEDQLFGEDDDSAILQRDAIGYECRAIGDWAGVPAWSAWDDDLQMAGLDEMMGVYRDIVETKAKEMFASFPDPVTGDSQYRAVTFILMAKLRSYRCLDEWDSQWESGKVCEMRELFT